MNDRWFEAFRCDPDQAVSDVFSGRAGVGSHLRLDIPELLYQAFPPASTNERARLDIALLSWLSGMRDEYPAQVERLGFSVYGKRVGDALIALQLLDLPEARRRIRTDLDTWLRWLLPLRLAGGARTFFNRRFAAVRALYPRSPEHWESVLGEALDEFLEYARDQVSNELVDLLRTQWLAQARPSWRTQNSALVPVSQGEWEGLEADMTKSDHPPETLA